MGIIEEIKSFYTFYRKLAKRDIVFYAEDAASYRYLEGLINQLTTIHNQQICYITSDSNDPILSNENNNINALYLNKLLPCFTLTLTSKLLIMTVPDLGHFHVKRSELGTHHVYLFHNIGSSFPVIRHAALFNYDTIFCAGPHHIEEIRRQEEIYQLPPKNIVEFGYYSLEKIFDDYKKRSQPVPSKHKGRV